MRTDEAMAVEDLHSTLRAEITALREWIVMADNRLECKDCPDCVDVARSYLQAALAGEPFKLPPAFEQTAGDEK
jgi:hypothetical protein